MKKQMLKSLMILICLISSLSVFAAEYTTCTKISDIRALEDSTLVFYTGEAVTTFYGPGGILIQDETGSIYIKSYDMSKFCADPADAGYPNLKISAIAGIFHTATDMEMTHIEIEYDEDAYNIEVVAENVDFTIKDITLAELFANPMAYECQPVRLTEAVVHSTEYTNWFEYNEQEIAISTGQQGEAMSVPAEGTFVGYYGNNGTKGFILPDEKYITATAYNSILDLKEAIASELPLGILNPVLVNRVVKNNDGSTTLYIQEDFGWWGTYGTTVIVENLTANVVEGDSITGVRGYFTHLRIDGDKVYGSKIEQKGDLGKNIKVVSSGNELIVQAIQELEYIKGEGVINFESTLCSTPAGTIVKHGDKYYLRVVHSNTSSVDSVLIHGADFSSLVGEQHAIVGVVDAGVVNPGYPTFVLRSINDVLKDNYQFNTIAELRAAGKPLAPGVTYELINPVLVTFKREYNIDDINLVGVHVQDATGGIYVKKQVNADEKFEINAGDSVKNFKGLYVTTGRAVMLDFSDILNESEDTYNVISSGHAVDATPVEVTLSELAANRSQYASRVVKLSNLLQGDTTYIPWWTGGYPTTEYYLYQEGCAERMFYEWNYTLYEASNIVGVFDEGCDNVGFSIIPLSQAHITNAKSDATAIEQTIANNISVAYNNGVITLSEAVNAIEIYSVNGALIMAQEVNSAVINANLNSGVYVVRLITSNATETCKIMVK